MIVTLQCPTCGAPLDHDEKDERETIRCPFCNNTMMLPERARRAARRESVTHTFSRPHTSGGSRAGGVALGIIFLVLAFAGGIVYFVVRTISSTVSSVTRTVVAPNTKSTLAPTKPDPWAGYTQPDMSFGSEGIGPGHFKDARSIAVDAEGRIYVGEYSGGRVQVFDAAGKYLTQWMADTKMPLRGLAADRRGIVYIVQRNKITRYEGMTGKALGELSDGRRSGFDDVWVTADGGLVASAGSIQDDIIHFDSSGQVSKIITKAISSQTERSEMGVRVAADGSGNIYALGTFNNAVFKFSPDGRFLTQFGGAGDEQGQFRAPGAIAVDNQGRVYVSDFKGVQVFDANGRYINLIKVKGAASGMIFNDRNELFVVARTQVLKFAVNK
jgi:DNA-binding beta-propeller fold protein YncE